jgi:glyoxylase-like metal-dependent hydrolase (beta-lactamase superfamily II)
MALLSSRRDVITAGIAGLVGLSGVSQLQAAARPASTALNDRLTMISGAGGNVLALSTTEGLVLVDGGSLANAKALQSVLKKLPGGRRVQTLFNTHWHAEQTGSNLLYGKTGTTIVAHAKAQQRLATDQYLPKEDRYLKAQSKEALPTKTFYTNGEMTAGDEHIEYGHLLEAHTDGDIYVYFKDSNVLAVGDAVSPQLDPVLAWFEGGWLGGRIDSQAKLLRIGNDQTRIVASTGPVVTRAELKTERDALDNVFTRMSEAIRKGLTTADMQRSKLLDGLPRTWSDPDKFIYDAHKGMWAHHNTLSHQIV